MLMSKRHELLEEDDPRCVLHAWIGEFFMGGWPTNDREALTAAVVDELHYVNVADTTGIEIVEVSPPQTPKNDREKLLKQLPRPAREIVVCEKPLKMVVNGQVRSSVGLFRTSFNPFRRRILT